MRIPAVRLGELVQDWFENYSGGESSPPASPVAAAGAAGSRKRKPDAEQAAAPGSAVGSDAGAAASDRAAPREDKAGALVVRYALPAAVAAAGLSFVTLDVRRSQLPAFLRAARADAAAGDADALSVLSRLRAYFHDTFRLNLSAASVDAVGTPLFFVSAGGAASFFKKLDAMLHFLDDIAAFSQPRGAAKPLAS